MPTPTNNQPPELKPAPPPSEPKIFNRVPRQTFFVAVAVVAAALVAGGGVYFWMREQVDSVSTALNQRISELESQLLEQNKPADKADVIDTLDWKTYQNEEYGFEFEYPATKGFSIEESDAVNTVKSDIFFEYNKKEVRLKELGPPEYYIITLGIADDNSIKAHQPDPTCKGMCPFVPFKPLECEILLKNGDLDDQAGGLKEGDGFMYRVLNIGQRKGCDQNIWNVFGESGADRVAVFYGPDGSRFEFRADLGYGADPQVTKILSDDGKVEQNLVSYHPKNNSILLLDQILSTFKFL